MTYTADFNAYNFPWWSGAKDNVADIEAAGKMGELETYIEEMFADRETPPTETELNDFVWFERDTIFRALGIDECEEDE